MVVPYDYARNLARERPTTLQFLLNAMNANTATISQAYAEGVIQSYNGGLRKQGIHVGTPKVPGADLVHRGQVQLHPRFSTTRGWWIPGLSSPASSVCC